MNKEELLSQINDLSSVVGAAREGLAKDEVVAMEDIVENVSETCSAVTDLPPDDAIEVRPHLVELLENLQQLSDDLQEKLTGLDEQADPDSADGTVESETGEAEPRADSAEDEND